MTKNNSFAKIGFYLLSMLFFVIIVIILGTKIPYYFGSDYVFLGVNVFLRKGVLVPIICGLLLIATAYFVYRLHHHNKGSRLGPISIEEIENVNSDIMTFVASYFFPLVSFNIGTTWRHIIVLFGLFVLIGVIYIKANIYYCNPTLSIMGYHVYKISGLSTNKRIIRCTIISHKKLSNGDKFKYIPIDSSTYFVYKI